MYKLANGVNSISTLTSWYCNAINGNDNPYFLLKKNMNGTYIIYDYMQSAGAKFPIILWYPGLIPPSYANSCHIYKKSA